jgi:hypothetical protein
MPAYSLLDLSISTADSGLLILRGLRIDTIADHTNTISADASQHRSPKHPNLVESVETILTAQSQELTLVQLKSLCWTLTVGRGNDIWANNVNHWDVFQTLWIEARRHFSTKNWHGIGAVSSPTPGENSVLNSSNPEGIHSFLGSATHGRRVFVTSKGIIGLGPALVQPGDIVVILFGGCTPFVLRPVDNYYLLIGECYIHSQMDGAAVEGWREGDGEIEEFYLR